MIRERVDAAESGRVSRVVDDMPLWQTPVRAHLRTIPGVEPPSGAARKDAVLLDLEGRAATKAALVYVRQKLVELYQSRRTRGDAFSFVTADDVDTILRNWPACPDEAKESVCPQHWRGSVFRRGWVQTGKSVPSLRKRMNGTAVACWRPAERAVA